MTNWIIEKIGFEKTFVICGILNFLLCIMNIIFAAMLFLKKDIKILIFLSISSILICLIFIFMHYIEENYEKH